MKTNDFSKDDVSSVKDELIDENQLEDVIGGINEEKQLCACFCLSGNSNTTTPIKEE